MEYTGSLPAPPGTHQSYRLSQSRAYKAQANLTLSWPDCKLAGYLQGDLAASEHCAQSWSVSVGNSRFGWAGSREEPALP